MEGALKEVKWNFNPPHASHFGGVWERKVGAVKKVLEGSVAQLSGRVLTTDEFTTLLYEAASIVNNTPMWEVSSDPNDPLPITPAMLMTLRDSTNPPVEALTEIDVAAYGSKRWRRVQFIAECFWKKWRLNYLSELQKRSKWLQVKTNLKPNDIVLVRNKDEKRNCWPVAVVCKTKQGPDGLVRSATVETVKKGEVRRTYERPITELILLVPFERN